MDEVEVKVLATELKSLSQKVDTGIADIKAILQESSSALKEHVKEDHTTLEEFRNEIVDIKIDMTKFKERWLLIGGAISLGGGAVIELLIHSALGTH